MVTRRGFIAALATLPFVHRIAPRIRDSAPVLLTKGERVVPLKDLNRIVGVALAPIKQGCSGPVCDWDVHHDWIHLTAGEDLDVGDYVMNDAQGRVVKARA